MRFHVKVIRGRTLNPKLCDETTEKVDWFKEWSISTTKQKPGLKWPKKRYSLRINKETNSYETEFEQIDQSVSYPLFPIFRWIFHTSFEITPPTNKKNAFNSINYSIALFKSVCAYVRFLCECKIKCVHV